MAPTAAILVIALFIVSYRQSTQTVIFVSGRRNVFIHHLHSGKVIFSILRCIADYLALLLTVQGIEPNPGPVAHGSFDDNVVFKKKQPAAVPGTQTEEESDEEDSTQANIACWDKTQAQTAIDSISQTQTTIVSLNSTHVRSAIACLESRLAQTTIVCVEKTHGSMSTRHADTVPSTNDYNTAPANDDAESISSDEVDSASDDEAVYASDYMSDDDSIDSLPFDDVKGECSTANDDAYYEEGYMTDDDVESLPYDDIDDEARSELYDGNDDEARSELFDGIDDEARSELYDDIDDEARSELYDDIDDEAKSELYDDIDDEARSELYDGNDDEARSELYRQKTDTIAMENGKSFFDDNISSINDADIIVRKKFAMVDDVVHFDAAYENTSIDERINTKRDDICPSDIDSLLESWPCEDTVFDDVCLREVDSLLKSWPCDDAELDDVCFSDVDSLLESWPCDDAELLDDVCLSDVDSLLKSWPCNDAELDDVCFSDDDNLLESWPCDDDDVTQASINKKISTEASLGNLHDTIYNKSTRSADISTTTGEVVLAEDLVNKPPECQNNIPKLLEVVPCVSSYDKLADEDQALKESDITIFVPSHHVNKAPSSPMNLLDSVSSNSKNVYEGHMSDDSIFDKTRGTVDVREAVNNPDRKRKWRPRIKHRRSNKYRHNNGDEIIRKSLSEPTTCTIDNNQENNQTAIPSHTETPCREKLKATKRKSQGRKEVTHSGKQLNKSDDMSDTVQVKEVTHSEKQFNKSDDMSDTVQVKKMTHSKNQFNKPEDMSDTVQVKKVTHSKKQLNQPEDMSDTVQVKKVTHSKKQFNKPEDMSDTVQVKQVTHSGKQLNQPNDMLNTVQVKKVTQSGKQLNKPEGMLDTVQVKKVTHSEKQFNKSEDRSDTVQVKKVTHSEKQFNKSEDMSDTVQVKKMTHSEKQFNKSEDMSDTVQVKKVTHSEKQFNKSEDMSDTVQVKKVTHSEKQFNKSEDMSDTVQVKKVTHSGIQLNKPEDMSDTVQVKKVTHSGEQLNKSEDMSDTVHVNHPVIPTINEDSRTSGVISKPNQYSSTCSIKPTKNEIRKEIQKPQIQNNQSKVIDKSGESCGVSMFYQATTESTTPHDGPKKSHISRFKDRLTKKKNKKRRQKEREEFQRYNKVNYTKKTIDATIVYQDIKPEYLILLAPKLTKTERVKDETASVWTAGKKKDKPLKIAEFLRRFL